jgi:hypothetical protein
VKYGPAVVSPAAWRLSRKRKPFASSKYYFFDVGVAGELARHPVRRRLEQEVLERDSIAADEDAA